MAVTRTFSIIKPDATRRNLTGKINAVIEDAGLRIVAQRRVKLTTDQAKKFYEVHAERPFYGELVEQMTAEPERPDGDQDRDHDLPRAGRLARRDRDNAGQASDQAGPECPADIDPSRGPGPALNEPGYRHNRRHRECHDDELEDQREQAHGAIFRRSHHMRING